MNGKIRTQAYRANQIVGPDDSSLLTVSRMGPLVYYPLDDVDANCLDRSGNGYNGTHNGVTLEQPGIGAGSLSAYWDGSGDYTDVISAGLRSAWPTVDLSISVWLKLDAGAWGDSVNRRPFIFTNAAFTNQVSVQKHPTANTLECLFTTDAGVHQIDYNTSRTDWFNLILIASDSAGSGVFRIYADNALVGEITVGIGAGLGDPDQRCLLGAVDTVPSQVWLGHIAHFAAFNRLLSAGERAILAGMAS